MNQNNYAWHPADILAAVSKRGSTLAEIARQAGLSTSATRTSLRNRCYVGEQAVANFLQIPAHVIWPDRYDNDGIPLHPRVRKKYFNELNDKKSSKNCAAA